MSWSTLILILFSNLFGLSLQECATGDYGIGIGIVCDTTSRAAFTPPPPPEEEESTGATSQAAIDSTTLKTPRISNGF